MKFKWIIMYAVLVLLLLGWLGVSTTVVTRLSGSSMSKIDFDEVRDAKEGRLIYLGIEHIRYLNDLTEDIHIDGWAYAETAKDNSERYVSFLLRGDEADYEFKVDNYVGRSEFHWLDPDRLIPNDHIGFNFDQETASIKNGTYQLWISCWENDTDHGIAQTGYQLQKNNGELLIMPWEAKKTEPVSTTEDGSINFALDDLKMANGQLFFRGWAFAPDLDTIYQKIYLRLTDEEGNDMYYSARNMMREDIRDAFESSLYLCSGYEVYIAQNEIPDGNYTACILLENDGRVWSSGTWDICKSDSSIERIEKPWTSSKTEAIEATEDDPINFALDKMEIVDDRVGFVGWAFVPNLDTNGQKIYIRLTDGEGNDMYYAAREVMRGDVADAHESSLYLRSGYEIYIDKSEIPDGDYTACLLLENGGKVWESDTWRFSKSTSSVKRL